ncbi:MAG: hypothetical protein ACR2G6_16980 [Gemmatimonadaceae bacterium]
MRKPIRIPLAHPADYYCGTNSRPAATPAPLGETIPLIGKDSAVVAQMI